MQNFKIVCEKINNKDWKCQELKHFLKVLSDIEPMIANHDFNWLNNEEFGELLYLGSQNDWAKAKNWI